MRWWVSFAMEEKNLGCCIADGNSLQEVINKCTINHCNPGGDAVGIPIDEEIASKNHATYAWLNSMPKYKLIQKHEIPEFTQPMTLEEAEMDPEFKGVPVEVMCQECNKKESNET